MVIMSCFNSWNWYLAFTGLTSIERLSKNKKVFIFHKSRGLSLIMIMGLIIYLLPLEPKGTFCTYIIASLRY